MSTKDLARTIIEGGRRGRNRYERRHSNKRERVAEQEVSSGMVRLGDFDGFSYRPRTPLYRDFNDKLAPGQRWMRRQVGRPWDKVRSELLQRFDVRTTAGRHIVFDHLLRSVQTGEVKPSWYYFDFRVDRHGILREVETPRYQGWRRPEPLPEPENVILEWLAARRVGEHGTHLYWFVPTPAGMYRQSTALHASDAARWRALPAWFRERCSALASRVGVGEGKSWPRR